MKESVHLGVTVSILCVADLLHHGNYDTNKEARVIVTSLVCGVLIDADKIFEILSNKIRKRKGLTPDITAQCRIFHNLFAFIFGFGLSWLVSSFLPLIAVLFHVVLDSFVPAIEKNGKNYPSHPPFKWLLIPFVRKIWNMAIIGWPITYPPKFNFIYNRLGPAIGYILLFICACYCTMKVIK